jgi:hypothetical protein
MLAPGARGTLQPGDLQALAGVFEPALGWAAEDARAALTREDACAERLARALEAAQTRAWTAAAADLERLLREAQDSLLVRLLSSGLDWDEAARRKPTAPAEGTPGDAAGGK